MLSNQIIDQIIIPISISIIAGALIYFSFKKVSLKIRVKKCFLALIVFALFVLSIKYFSQPEISSVPMLIGKSIDEAKIIASDNKFKIEMNENWNLNYDAGIVYEQEPNPGISLSEGKVITLVVSRGSQLSLTPSVLHLHKDEAIKIIQSVSLDVETEYVPNTKFQKGMVVKQDPKPNTKISIGSKVLLSISSGIVTETMKSKNTTVSNGVSMIVGMPYLIYAINDNNWSESYIEPVVFNQPLFKSSHIVFRLITSGTFEMGSPNNEKGRIEKSEGIFPDNGRHQVILTENYYISVAEITNGQWKNLFSGVKHEASQYDDEHPVNWVRWVEAVEFCEKMNQKQKKFEVNLPTEAQWEYAARAGTKTRYFFGNGDPLYTELMKYAWVVENSKGTPHPVGLKKPNPWGLYDILGNISEWCRDGYYDGYPKGPRINPYIENKSHGYAVIRGSCFGISGYFARCSYRRLGQIDRNARGNTWGFRIVGKIKG